MNLYGYRVEGSDNADGPLLPLQEVTMSGTPSELRAIAEFLTGCALEMERLGSAFDHIHLSDRVKSFNTSPQFVVASTGI